jgi:hypothetical protein
LSHSSRPTILDIAEIAKSYFKGGYGYRRMISVPHSGIPGAGCSLKCSQL